MVCVQGTCQLIFKCLPHAAFSLAREAHPLGKMNSVDGGGTGLRGVMDSAPSWKYERPLSRAIACNTGICGCFRSARADRDDVSVESEEREGVN